VDVIDGLGALACGTLVAGMTVWRLHGRAVDWLALAVMIMTARVICVARQGDGFETAVGLASLVMAVMATCAKVHVMRAPTNQKGEEGK